MFTLGGFFDETDHWPTADAVDAIPDPYLKVSGNDLYVPSQNKLLAVYAAGQVMGGCRLQSPSLRRMANQRIAPVGHFPLPANLASWNVPLLLHDYKNNPRTLDVAEALNAYCTNDGDIGEWVFVWLMDALAPLPGGEIFTILATSSITGVVANWVNGALTFVQTLPAGRYAIVGMRVENDKCVAARLVFPDVSQRPGCVSSFDAFREDHPFFRQGYLGSWGEFEHDAPPSVDFIQNAVGLTYPVVIFDLIQTRAGRRA